MSKKKWCPMSDGGKCNDGCAWWSTQEEQCAVLAIATHLRLQTISRNGPEW